MYSFYLRQVVEIEQKKQKENQIWREKETKTHAVIFSGENYIKKVSITALACAFPAILPTVNNPPIAPKHSTPIRIPNRPCFGWILIATAT